MAEPDALPGFVLHDDEDVPEVDALVEDEGAEDAELFMADEEYDGLPDEYEEGPA